MPYDLRVDFAPIALLAQAPQLVLARKTMPVDDLAGLIAWMKANPGKATIGTAGVGSPPHIAAVFFLKLTDTSAQLVSYRGGLPAVQDLVAGQIDMVFGDPTSSVPQVRAGTIKAFAISAGERLPALPDVPSTDEAGLPGFHVSTWNALFAPKGSPPDIIARLNAAAVTALADPTVRARFASLGRTFPRATSRRRRRWAPCSQRTSRSGGRSSRRPASSRNENQAGRYFGRPIRKGLRMA